MLIDRETLYSFCDELRAARRARRLVQVSVAKLIKEKEALVENVKFWVAVNKDERAVSAKLRVENERLREELKRYVRGAGYRYTEGGN